MQEYRGPWTGDGILHFVLQWWGKSAKEWAQILGTVKDPNEELSEDDIRNQKLIEMAQDAQEGGGSAAAAAAADWLP